MNYWWVNHKQTYKHEIQGGYIWSPKTKANGRANESYLTLTRVQPGDVVVSYADGQIKALGVATAAHREEAKPEDFGSVGDVWDAAGWLVPVEWELLQKPLRPKEHLAEIAPLLPGKHSPIRKETGDGNQGCYLAAISPELGQLLQRLACEERAEASVLHGVPPIGARRSSRAETVTDPKDDAVAQVWFINTDAKHFKPQRSPHDEWLRRGVAVASDSKKRDVLARIAVGDRLLMYANNVGVVAHGRMLDDEIVDVVDDMINPLEAIEHHRRVDWTSLTSKPFTPSELRELLYVPLSGITPIRAKDRLVQFIKILDGLAQNSSDVKSGAGFIADAVKRAVVERHAVERAKAFYLSQGFSVRELGKPYDLLCLRTVEGSSTSERVHVEVKGSTSDASVVRLTRNEVKNAQFPEGWRSDLYIVSNIQVRVGERAAWEASGGVNRWIENWSPRNEDLVATEFEYRVPLI